MVKKDLEEKWHAGSIWEMRCPPQRSSACFPLLILEWLHAFVSSEIRNYLFRTPGAIQVKTHCFSRFHCVYVNTVFPLWPATVSKVEKSPNESGWGAGEKMAPEERLVAGNFRDQTPTARLEHKPGFARKSGIATPPSARLRNALFGARFGHLP